MNTKINETKIICCTAHVYKIIGSLNHITVWSTLDNGHYILYMYMQAIVGRMYMFVGENSQQCIFIAPLHFSFLTVAVLNASHNSISSCGQLGALKSESQPDMHT